MFLVPELVQTSLRKVLCYKVKRRVYKHVCPQISETDSVWVAFLCRWARPCIAHSPTLFSELLSLNASDFDWSSNCSSCSAQSRFSKILPDSLLMCDGLWSTPAECTWVSDQSDDLKLRQGSLTMLVPAVMMT